MPVDVVPGAGRRVLLAARRPALPRLPQGLQRPGHEHRHAMGQHLQHGREFIGCPVRRRGVHGSGCVDRIAPVGGHPPSAGGHVPGHPGLAEADQPVGAEPGEEAVGPDQLQGRAAGTPPGSVREEQRHRQLADRRRRQSPGHGRMHRDAGHVEQPRPHAGRGPGSRVPAGRGEQCHRWAGPFSSGRLGEPAGHPRHRRFGAGRRTDGPGGMSIILTDRSRPATRARSVHDQADGVPADHPDRMTVSRPTASSDQPGKPSIRLPAGHFGRIAPMPAGARAPVDPASAAVLASLPPGTGGLHIRIALAPMRGVRAPVVQSRRGRGLVVAEDAGVADGRSLVLGARRPAVPHATRRRCAGPRPRGGRSPWPARSRTSRPAAPPSDWTAEPRHGRRPCAPAWRPTDGSSWCAWPGPAGPADAGRPTRPRPDRPGSCA